ncbi:heat-inducible transcription repressor HrcA [Leptotrichia sp. OH3620_COT-345]|uniref:heat-inducible transcriptional repressor HrcA n=1 Tax=Leptotrichia sp. OH3620_COT-345 TaxID=2491048 RepID=UPI000F64BFA2|nr:heat-inducible transcriptional repressor HrcA [Leptotrichia sp. OH3620_COT-345]RRD40260.1 heat-inducible transcription repressor HrcA [Leptotrichia sp. OH3620_COT-345]
MNDRERMILKSIIKHYLEFGESVGSRTLEKKYSIGVSSATIRNTMADLEDKGLIVKTHTSSGRIPTSEGYRIYVEELIKIRDISAEAKAKVVEAYNKKMNQLDKIFEETSRLLSKISRYAGVVLEPAIRQEGVKKVKLVHITDTNILAVVVMDSFLTKNLNIFLETPIGEDEVESINMLLNEKIKNSPKIFTLSDLGEFFMNTDLCVSEELEYENEQIINEGKLFFEGGTNLLESNVSDVMKVIDRVKLFNNPNDMKQIFSQFIQTEQYKDGEVNVIFGEDLDIAGLEDFSFVFSVYTMGDAKGIMGIIGPKRMEYSKTVGLVEYVSEEVKQLLKKK